MSLQLLSSGAGKCPHTLVHGCCTHWDIEGGSAVVPRPSLCLQKGSEGVSAPWWVSAGRGHVSLLLWGSWHLAQGSHTHATALLGTTTAEIQYKQGGTMHCAVAGLVKCVVLQNCPIFSVPHQVNKGLTPCPAPPSSFRLGCTVKSCSLFWQKVQRRFNSLGECTFSCGDTPGAAFLHQQLHWSNFLTLPQLVSPRSFISLHTHFADHEHMCGCQWLSCFDPIHKYQEESFLHFFFSPA